MFDYLEAAAYHKLRSGIIAIVEKAFDEDPEHYAFFSGKMRALAEVLNLMNAVDNELFEKCRLEDEKLDGYYKVERSADNSAHE